MSSGYTFFHQGGQETCVFSSLASALSYKGYNDATEIISRNIQGSLSYGDTITYTADLLRTSKESSVQVDRYTGETTIIKSTDFPTIFQITAKYAISICGNQIFDSNFQGPMKLSLDNLTRCCKKRK